MDLELLRTLKVDGYVLTASKDHFKASFEWLSNSLSVVSNSKPDSKTSLPAPDKQISWVQSVEVN